MSLLTTFQEFRQAIIDEAASTGRTPLLLTAAVSAGKPTIDAGYDVDLIQAYVLFTKLTLIVTTKWVLIKQITCGRHLPFVMFNFYHIV